MLAHARTPTIPEPARVNAVAGQMATRLHLDPMHIALGRFLPTPCPASDVDSSFSVGIANDFFWKFFAGVGHYSDLRPNGLILDKLGDIFTRSTIGHEFVSRASAYLVYLALMELIKDKQQKQEQTMPASLQNHKNDLQSALENIDITKADIASIAKNVGQQLDNLMDIVRAAGKTDGELRNIDISRVVRIAKTVDMNIVRQFLGAARGVFSNRKTRIHRVGLTREFLNVFPSEFAMLGDDLLGDIKLVQFVEHGLLGVEPYRHGGRGGNILVAIDGSQSMERDYHLEWAHALFLALFEASGDISRQCRGFVFGSENEIRAGDILNVLGFYFGSGTSFDGAIHYALKFLSPGDELIIITDGEDSISPGIRKSFKASGAALTAFIIGDGDGSAFEGIARAIVNINEINQQSIERAAQSLMAIVDADNGIDDI